MFGAKNVELKTLELYQENGAYYLKAVYGYENDHGIYEMTIPKISLPVWRHSQPIISREIGDTIDSGHGVIDLGFGGLDIVKTNCTSRKGTKLKNIEYYIETIEEKPRTLTLHEIEQKLGYKINLVSEK